MRYLSRFCATLMLVSVLAVSAYAGDIECPAVTSQPPQVTGEIPNDAESSDTITEAALALLLALF